MTRISARMIADQKTRDQKQDKVRVGNPVFYLCFSDPRLYPR
jgi:hypothetical protein